jgi:hypothetical protein
LSSPLNIVNGQYNAAIFQNHNSLAKCEMEVKLNLEEGKYIHQKFGQNISLQLV